MAPFGSNSQSSQLSDPGLPTYAHRPYRYGMALLCLGGLLNWIGLFENYAEPVRYVGVGCVVAGAALLCFALCCWLRPRPEHSPPSHASSLNLDTSLTQVEVVPAANNSSSSKPPDYEAVADPPPSYEDAIKLSPAQLLWIQEESRHSSPVR